MYTIVASGIYVPARLVEQGILKEACCPWCGVDPDEYHMCYDCPEINKDPKLVGSADLKDKVGILAEDFLRLVYSGVIPMSLTINIPKTPDVETTLKVPGIVGSIFRRYFHTFIDGVGGPPREEGE